MLRILSLEGKFIVHLFHISALSGIDLLNSFVGRHPFSKVAADNDQKRRARLQGRTQEEMEVIEHQRKYDFSVKLV